MSIPPGFELNTAKKCARYCDAVYKMFRWSWVSRFFRPKDLIYVGDIRAQSFTGKSELLGFLGRQSETYYAAFRGTITTSEWQANVLMAQSAYLLLQDFGQVHVGFQTMYASFREQLLQMLPDGDGGGKKLIITGHSLGAALGTLLAPDAKQNKHYPEVELYTFGSPRVGNPEFTRKFSEKIGSSFRVVNTPDLIPTLPPEKFTHFEYRHVPTKVEVLHLGGNNHDIQYYIQALNTLGRTLSWRK